MSRKGILAAVSTPYFSLGKGRAGFIKGFTFGWMFGENWQIDT